MTSVKTTQVSVIIVTWNSAKTLPRCLEALTAQSFRDFEVVVVDNGSTDGCTDALETRYPALDLTLLQLEKNRGYAAGNNIAAKISKGAWLALLNADAFPEPGWLTCLMNAAERLPAFSTFSSRLIMADDPRRLDGEGDVYHVSGLAWRRNHGKASDIPSVEEEVFSACGAAALFRKEIFLQADGFDERYFAYNEDVDLGFRLRLLGHRCMYVPSARVNHVGSASTSRRSNTSIYYGHRNLVWTFFKNMPAGLLLLFLPSHLIMTLLYLVYYSFSGKGRAIWKAKLDALCQLPQILQVRFMIQSARKINSNQIYLQMNKSWLLSHWVERVKSS